MRANVEDEEFDWSSLVPHVVHPVKVAIVEATLWIGRPLSASDLCRSFGVEHNVSLVSYHQVQLAKLGVLERVATRPARGAEEKFYFFPGR